MEIKFEVQSNILHEYHPKKLFMLNFTIALIMIKYSKNCLTLSLTNHFFPLNHFLNWDN